MIATMREPIVARRKARSDAQLHRMVLDELRWDADVRETTVGVEIDRGTVTLTGTVGNYSEKMAVQRAAQRVEGVRGVINNLQVACHPDPVADDDTRIAQNIHHVLESDVRIPEQGIQITVNRGYVLLEGTVPTLLARYRAEQAVENLRGVSEVVNRLMVQPSDARAGEVRFAIEQALERQTAHRPQRIRVELKDGMVTLSGRVRSWLEREAAYQAAAHAPGVRSVVNLLRIEPYA